MGQSEGERTGERIAKRLARAGIASRRDAEKLIAEGRVAVNGKVLNSPALNVADEAVITVDGKPVAAAAPTRLWRYHKPAGLVTTHRDPEGRRTVFDALPPELPRVISVGRLDLNSEGLLLLTNDGALARQLELPQMGWKRRYRARVFGPVREADLKRLEQGLTIEGVRYAPAEAHLDEAHATGKNSWITIALTEGKNREVRRLLEHIGLSVNRLIRLSFGPFQLGKLPVRAVEEVPARVLREQLGASAPKPPARKRRTKA
jgi:23S rRNA pseudouridine2605 synthase